MAIGKYLSLPEARIRKLLDRFVKQHPSTGDEDEFDRLLDAMTKKPESADQTFDRHIATKIETKLELT